jgi:tyrosyl-tRNA synthetase
MSSPTGREQLLRHADAVVPEDELDEKLALGRPLRVKLGVDPTAPAVTLGWAVVLRKLRHFQELGHTAVLIIGDFTAQVGDPSERDSTRRRLSASEVNGYAENVLGQFEKILLPEPLEVRRNSEWLSTMGMPEILELTSAATVAQMMERADFDKRYDEGTPISVMEFLYPLLQGYDSVAVEADVELGGGDQLWNLMMGRSVQEKYGMEPQVALTMPILVGLDGVRRMGQSLDNYIGIDDPPEEMFGKTMSIPDEAMSSWFRLAADLPVDQVEKIETDLETGRLPAVEAKRRLAREIVGLYWGEDAAQQAEEEFDRVFKRGEEPESMPEHPLGDDDPVHLPSLLREVFSVSGTEAKRLIDQGAVTLDGDGVQEQHLPRNKLAGRVLKVGKRRFARLVG